MTTDYVALAHEHCRAVHHYDGHQDGYEFTPDGLRAFAARIAQPATDTDAPLEELLDALDANAQEPNTQTYDRVSVAKGVARNVMAAPAAVSVAPSQDREDALRIKNAGWMLSNIAFNWSQMPGYVLTKHDCELLDKCRKEWDAARQAPKEPEA